MSLVLESKAGGDFKPHVEGIHPAVCVDVIDLGLVETEFQGQKRLVNKVRIFFETEQRNEEGKNCIVTKTFTASLNTKARLAEFLSKWRGRPIVPGESIDLAKLIGANCTLVISHQQNMVGRTYASIDAVSKPTKRLVASGQYDPVAARQRVAEWRAKEQATRGTQSGRGLPQSKWQAEPGPIAPGGAAPMNTTNATDGTNRTAAAQATPKSGAGAPHSKAEPPPFDPEVGF